MPSNLKLIAGVLGVCVSAHNSVHSSNMQGQSRVSDLMGGGSEDMDVTVSPDGSVSARSAAPVSTVRRNVQQVATTTSGTRVDNFVSSKPQAVLRRVEGKPQEVSEIPEGSELNNPVLMIYDPIDMNRKHDVSEEQVLNLLTQVRAAGWPYQLVGTGTQWAGWGSKVLALIEELKSLDRKQLVIVPDSRDVLINTAPGGMQAFVTEFTKLVANHSNAVVAAGDANCCVAAMNQAERPGHLIAGDGSRRTKACTSGFGDCVHKGEEGDKHWKTYFDKLATKRGYDHARFPYLNGQVLAGRAGDLLRVYEFLQIDAEEDDQALLSEAIYRRPNWLVLDYEQRLFGTNSWSDDHPWHHHHAVKESGCLYDWEQSGNGIGHFKSRVTGHAPLFIHTSGQFFNCYKKLQK